MKKLILMLFVLSVPAYAKDYVIDFKDTATLEQIQDISNELGFSYQPNSVMFPKTKIVKADLTVDQVESLAENNLISSVQQNKLYYLDPLEVRNYSEGEGEGEGEGEPYPNDPLYLTGHQWNMDAIGMRQVWSGSARGEGITVAVIDTGLATGEDEGGPRVPDLSQTCVFRGYNFVTDSGDTTDFHGHGTHVAGTIAQSTNNGLGVTGVAPGVCILPLNVFGKNPYAEQIDIADAIYAATVFGARVINMSLGGPGSDPIIAEAVKYADEQGVFLVCAAGNSGRPIEDYPAGYKECHAISAIGPDLKLAWYSSFGPSADGKEIFLAAPGGNIKFGGPLGGIWQDTIVTGDPTTHGYFPFNGTSMAAPHVAGAAALLFAQDPERTSADVEKILQDSANDQDDVDHFGHGILNVGAAVEDGDESSFLAKANKLAIPLGLMTALSLLLSRKKSNV